MQYAAYQAWSKYLGSCLMFLAASITLVESPLNSASNYLALGRGPLIPFVEEEVTANRMLRYRHQWMWDHGDDDDDDDDD